MGRRPVNPQRFRILQRHGARMGNVQYRQSIDGAIRQALQLRNGELQQSDGQGWETIAIVENGSMRQVPPNQRAYVLSLKKQITELEIEIGKIKQESTTLSLYCER